ncbi:MAG: NAD(P)/FAD-dependent oxidoreductase [Thermodesulfobacteriota bacterium]
MKIAIIGAGISGLVTARLLNRDHDITVFEANDYIGGHTRTVEVSDGERTQAVDTGFIVFNDKTYPNFVRLMGRLSIARRPSRMSFSVKCEQTGLEYSPSSPNALFARRQNLLSLPFYRMLLDIFRFRLGSKTLLLENDHRVTLGEYLARKRYSRSFVRHFILPMGAAIWSADPKGFRLFPARYFVQFFDNHGFLNVVNQPRWYVIRGGSSSYIGPLTHRFRERIRLNSPVRSVRRSPDHVEVTSRDGKPEKFDAAVIAAHSDQALAMLGDPSDEERGILRSIPYQENEVLLHTDISVLPDRRAAWASWNYRIPRNGEDRVHVTYNMNMLQSLDAAKTFCLSLNQKRDVRSEYILREFVYHHPVYHPEGVAAQGRRERINGVNRTWFCGAYWGAGFHEDGVNSALAVCKDFGKTLNDA